MDQETLTFLGSKDIGFTLNALAISKSTATGISLSPLSYLDICDLSFLIMSARRCCDILLRFLADLILKAIPIVDSIHNLAMDVKHLFIVESKKVRDIRSKRGLSQEYVAEVSGIERSQISRKEKGKIEVSIDDLLQLSKAIGVTIPELFSDIEPESNARKIEILKRLDRAPQIIDQIDVISKALSEQSETIEEKADRIARKYESVPKKEERKKQA